MEDHCNARVRTAERNSDSIQIKPSGPKASMRQRKALQLGTHWQSSNAYSTSMVSTSEDGNLLELNCPSCLILQISGIYLYS